LVAPRFLCVFRLTCRPDASGASRGKGGIALHALMDPTLSGSSATRCLVWAGTHKSLGQIEHNLPRGLDAFPICVVK